MNFDKLVEQKIREAMEAGEFEGLEGEGRPVNLDAYFATPPELRAGYAVLKNAGVLPEEAQLLKEINELRPRLELAREEPERERLKRAVVELTLKYNLLVERYRGKRRSD
ncbi:MAG TPA: DnaJ family domain-containing protein [Pyrinomonadaceae bacterium]|nr:DnaJ family domain-containing protein [Pyrinomonadaceae bacterium]